MRPSVKVFCSRIRWVVVSQPAPASLGRTYSSTLRRALRPLLCSLAMSFCFNHAKTVIHIGEREAAHDALPGREKYNRSVRAIQHRSRLYMEGYLFVELPLW